MLATLRTSIFQNGSKRPRPSDLAHLITNLINHLLLTPSLCHLEGKLVIQEPLGIKIATPTGAHSLSSFHHY